MVPYHRAGTVGKETDYVAQVIASGRLGAGGAFGERCAELLQRRLGVPVVTPTKSCTAALEMMALLLDLREGDEVVLPSFAYVTTANAFALRGARLVFADVRPDTLNIDPASVRELITSRTRAIVALHYAGVGCDMDALGAICAERDIPIVEDNAHGLGGSYRGQPLGSFGELSSISFHETKSVTCGEGGALAIRDPRHVERAEMILEKGTDRARFIRGEVGRYTWNGLGSSYGLSELLAAFLCAQLEELDRILDVRRRQCERYTRELADWSAAECVRLPQVPAECESSHQVYHLLLPDGSTRDRFIEEVGARGVRTVFHFLPLHVSPMGRALGGEAGDCPVAEDASRRLVRLPLFGGMTDDEQSRVIDVVRSFRS